jgi:hypothetical protein
VTAALRSELPQMMIQMFVHPPTPLFWRQLAKKWMRMFRAPALPAFMKLTDLQLELLLFAQKIPLI